LDQEGKHHLKPFQFSKYNYFKIKAKFKLT